MAEKLRAAIIGFGLRGCSLAPTLAGIEEMEITSICDLNEELLNKGGEILEGLGVHPARYTDYHEIIARGETDLVFVVTDWITHIAISIDFMEAGIPAAMEVGGATSVDECWDLVHAYERTGTPVMMLENCCYGRMELAALRMAREGVLGRVVYAECGYCHDLRPGFVKYGKRHRVMANLHRNGDLYPTHGIGPVARILNINRGNRFVSIASMSSPAAGMKDYVDREHPDCYLKGQSFACGDVTSSLIQCAHGELVMMRHNVTLPRPYSRAFMVQGTQGVLSEDKNGYFLDGMEDHEKWAPMEDVWKNYEHPIWQNYTASEKDAHGGMDRLAARDFVLAVRDKRPMPIDVYDTATWMALTALSEQSVAMGGAVQNIPDFTRGKWSEREPEDMAVFD